MRERLVAFRPCPPKSRPSQPAHFQPIFFPPKLPCCPAKEKTELSSARGNIVEERTGAASDGLYQYLGKGSGYFQTSSFPRKSPIFLLPTSQSVDLQSGPLYHILDNLLEWHFFRGRLLLQFLPPHDFGHETLTFSSSEGSSKMITITVKRHMETSW